jgi:hypothetical protein
VYWGTLWPTDILKQNSKSITKQTHTDTDMVKDMFKKDIMDKDNYMWSCLINCKYRIDTYIIQTENKIQCRRVDPMHVW